MASSYPMLRYGSSGQEVRRLQQALNRAGYSLYDAQLAVAEAVKRQLDRKSVALIIAECGAGKSVRRS